MAISLWQSTGAGSISRQVTRADDCHPSTHVSWVLSLPIEGNEWHFLWQSKDAGSLSRQVTLAGNSHAPVYVSYVLLLPIEGIEWQFLVAKQGCSQLEPPGHSRWRLSCSKASSMALRLAAAFMPCPCRS